MTETDVTVITDGLEFPEGPVWMDDGSVLVAELMGRRVTRVAPDDSSLAVSNQIGAVSKDTWVLSSEPESLSAFWLGGAPLDHEIEIDPSATLSARAAENLFWLGRYAERAEATARLLRAANTRRVEFEHSRPGPGVNALRALLVALTRVTATYPGFVGDEAEKQALLLGEPDVFFTVPGYDGLPLVMLRLAEVNVRRLRELVTDAWRMRGARAIDNLPE